VSDQRLAFTDSLHGIHMEMDPRIIFKQLADSLDRLDAADFIIDGHDAQQDRIFPYGFLKLLDGYDSVRIDRQVADFKA
jgi:hypothetical protein